MVRPDTRIGVYVCHCGINIGHVVDVERLVERALGLENVVVARNYPYMCSEPGQALIKEDIRDLGLTSIVVASCSPLMHEATFRRAAQEAGVNPYRVEIANIREQCSWVHEPGELATHKAGQLVASAVGKSNLLEELFERKSHVVSAALVIGAGVTGMQTALDIADAGFQVYLVERAETIGGWVTRLSHTFPTMEPVSGLLERFLNRLQSHPKIEIMTQSQVDAVGGCYGDFEATIRDEFDTATPINVGVIIVTTGYELFDPKRKPELGYSVYPQVITSMEFERLVSPSGPTKGEIVVAGRKPKNLVFIQCVGSRDRQVGNPHCSRICCMYTAKQAKMAIDRLSEAKVTVFYTDVRAYGKGFEEFYDEVREAGVLYRRGIPSEIVLDPAKEGVIVRVEDTLLHQSIEVPADMVVLAVGMEPRQTTSTISSLLHLAGSADGFLAEAHPKLRPVETAVAGVFIAGCCQSPKDISDSIAQGRAAAATALAPLMKGQVAVEAATAFVDPDICAGCETCVSHCTYGALELHPFLSVMTVNAVLCQGCGACAANCPSSAINLHHFTFEQTLAQVDALAGTASGFG